jgi:hypothetical protein
MAVATTHVSGRRLTSHYIDDKNPRQDAAMPCFLLLARPHAKNADYAMLCLWRASHLLTAAIVWAGCARRHLHRHHSSTTRNPCIRLSKPSFAPTKSKFPPVQTTTAQHPRVGLRSASTAGPPRATRRQLPPKCFGRSALSFTPSPTPTYPVTPSSPTESHAPLLSQTLLLLFGR